MVPVTHLAVTEWTRPDLEELDLLQHLLDEERALLQHRAALPPASENHVPVRDKQVCEQKRRFDDAGFTSQRGQEGLVVLNTSRGAPAGEESSQESNNIAALNRPPSPSVSKSVCHMVEDPYFDTSTSSPSSEEALKGSNEGIHQWTISPIFKTPSLFLNDTTLELPSDVSGKLSSLCSC